MSVSVQVQRKSVLSRWRYRAQNDVQATSALAVVSIVIVGSLVHKVTYQCFQECMYLSYLVKSVQDKIHVYMHHGL